jgi:hypothetical protein
MSRFKRGTDSAMGVVMQALKIYGYSFELPPSIFASSGSITGISSRIG